MSESVTNSSKTQFIIAIDDEDDTDDENKDNEIIDCNNDVFAIERSVSQTLESIIDKIDINLDKSVEQNVRLNVNKEHKSVEKVSDRVVRPIDEVEDIGDLEVNIYSKESDDDSDNEILIYDEEDIEAEDCMVIDEMTNDFANDIEQQIDGNEAKDSADMSAEIEFINETNSGDKSVDIEQKEEVIDISDDEEDCLIINDSFIKSNKSIGSKSSQQFKRSLSPIYSTEAFIPLSKPSTSSSFYDQRSSSSAQRSSSSAQRSSSSAHFSSTYDKRFNRFSNSSIIDLYRSTDTFDTNRVNTSSYSHPLNEAEGDETIPFLYDDPKPSTSSDLIGSSSDTEEIDLIAECVKLDRNIVRNVLNLIEDQCTVPFIVRYRQSVISGIDADKVRRINNVYNDLKNAKQRAKEVEASLKKQNRINPRLISALNRCKNVFEVEHLYQLCRKESESSERYRNLGLNDSAIHVLEGKRLDPNHFVNRFAVDLDSVEAVKEGWSAIIADIISKDCDVLEYLISSYRQEVPTLEVVMNEEKLKEMLRNKNPKTTETAKKYLRFNSFCKPIDKISAHCLMAIERGEGIGLLNVYIEFAAIILNKLIDFCLLKWNRAVPPFLVNCVRNAFNNQLKPNLSEYIRWELRHSAHMTALDVFRNNVKHLLLEPPLRGESVIGVDPGFDSGCKVAVVSAWGVPLQYLVLQLSTQNDCDISAAKLKDLMLSNDCSVIALGNGSGCRRFEDLLLQRIRSGFFKPINVKYKIINESGVSWYSVTNEAKADLPHCPPNIIGAISIARRLIDPLNELVKIDPKRLQVGMYMRDIDQDLVKKAFHEVAVECVSFCGVDVNVSSIDLLSKVAGLEPTIARLIKDKRDRDGLFTSRSQLKKIDGIGWKQFEQCAGFIKILPATSQLPVPMRKSFGNESPNKKFASSTDDYDPLDSTIIHPESYSSANTYIELIGATKDEIGKQSIRNKIKSCYSKFSLPEIAQLCNTHSANMKIIIEGLSNSIDFDYRINFAQIYVPEIQYFYELSEGSQLKGRVTNVTPMGAFIDCGIANGINAYLNARECVKHSIAVNDNLIVKIISIDKEMQRFRVSVLKVFKNNIKFV